MPWFSSLKGPLAEGFNHRAEIAAGEGGPVGASLNFAKSGHLQGGGEGYGHDR